MADMTIRVATLDDALILSELEKDCFTDPWGLSNFKTFLANPSFYFFIGEINKEIVAFGGMILIDSEAEIINVSVIPSMRRKGLGHIIVSHMLDFCRTNNVTDVLLEHRESNSAAATLYEGFGFIPYDIRRRYYSSPVEDAVLRKLTL